MHRSSTAWWWLALVLLLAVPTAGRAEIALLAPETASLPKADRQAIQDDVAILEHSLNRVGLRYHRFAVETITLHDLGRHDLLVLVNPIVNNGLVQLLTHHKDRGGRWVIYRPHTTAEFPDFLGVRRGPEAAPIPATAPQVLLPTERTGMPARVTLMPDVPPLPIIAADAAFEAGRWEIEHPYAALIRGPYGYLINTRPSSDPAHADLLLAMLGDLEPTIWRDAFEETRRATLHALQHTAAQWTVHRLKPDFTRDQRLKLEQELQALRKQLPAPVPRSPEIDIQKPLLAAGTQSHLRLQSQIQRLFAQMTPSRKGEIRAVYLQPAARQDWDAIMRQIKESGFNAALVQVSTSAVSIHPSAVLTPAAWAGGDSDELTAAAEAARRHNIALHAAHLCYSLAGADAARLEQYRTEDRLLRDADGKQHPYLNPADPRNVEHEVKILLELAQKYDLDGIHLIGLHYPAPTGIGADVSDLSRQQFENAHGRVTNWPDDVLKGTRQAQYDTWQRENINRLLYRVQREARQAKRHLRISASVTPDPVHEGPRLKQDWIAWAQQGWIDFAVLVTPAAEPDHFAIAVEAGVAAARGRIPVIPAVNGPALTEPVAILVHVDAAREQGADGFCLNWDGQSPTLTSQQLTVLRSGATAEGTWPAYLAPRAEWQLNPGIERAGLPRAFQSTERVQLEARLLNSSPLDAPLKSVQAELRLESPNGRLIALLSHYSQFTTRKERFTAPSGLFRPVIRGNMVFENGTTRPFVIRGPLCAGVTPDELTALQTIPTEAGGSTR